MALMLPGDQLVDRHPLDPPAVAGADHLLERRLSSSPLVQGKEARGRLAPAGDDEFLPGLDAGEEFGEVGLGVAHLDGLGHGDLRFGWREVRFTPSGASGQPLGLASIDKRRLSMATALLSGLYRWRKFYGV